MNYIFIAVLVVLFGVGQAQAKEQVPVEVNSVGVEKNEIETVEVSSLDDYPVNQETEFGSRGVVSLPATIYIAMGVVIAALLAGFFSYLTLISAKENKVSEFRLVWLDGLRDEISDFTAAIQCLLVVDASCDFYRNKIGADAWPFDAEVDWLKLREDSYKEVVRNISRIQLRLNPKHVVENPDGPEGKLMAAMYKAREYFNDGNYEECRECCEEVRAAASPILKSTWDSIKGGEPEYKKIRKNARNIIVSGVFMIYLLVSFIMISSYL